MAKLADIAECVRLERLRFRRSHGRGSGSWYEPMRQAERAFRKKVLGEADYQANLDLYSGPQNKFSVAFEEAVRWLAGMIFDLTGQGGGKLFSDVNISVLLTYREEARASGNFAIADMIRDSLILYGISVRDEPDAVLWAVWPFGDYLPGHRSNTRWNRVAKKGAA